MSAYISFSNALRKGEVNTAWSALSAESQKILTARAKAIADASDGGMSDNPKTLLVSGTGTAPDLKEVTLLRQQGNEAWVSVVPSEGSAREVRMVKESDGWKLDVSDLLED
ncbi:MAG: hypothetical protein IRZ16_24350 [Myxococcaceae bacterium]|nr:hypothetical protein [Myxococcaceae bacterium]